MLLDPTMNQPTASERLTVMLRATQYLGNLTLRQDPWAELAETLERFFQCEMVLIVRPGQDGELRLVHAFTCGIPPGEVLRLAGGEIRAVLETGFLGTQTLADPACSLAFLPLPRDRRITAVAIVGHGGSEPFSKEDLEILLTLGSLFGNVVARVETEAELRDQQQTLEKLVEQRTAELEKTNARLLRESAERRQAEGELRDSEAAMKAADRRKNEFLAILSHELRNPLAAIDNGMYVLDHGTPGSEQSCRAQAVIGRQVRQLSQLVDDLLDITRISRNKIQLKSQSMDLVQLVWRSADPARVTQMVGNLLINAGKFTDPGGRVVVEVLAQGPDRAEVAVTDTGIGMDADMLGRLFQPFQQADRSLDRSRGGLGLGLAVAKGLAELHGGGVTASSPGLGKGSRFVLTLPAAPGPDQAAVAPLTPAARPRRILVIEDNLDAALTLKMLLELSGHQVATAHTARTGLAKVRQQQPEVVFCDIGLPDTDGYTVAEALRADPAGRPPFLVAMTGYGREEDKRRALEAGFDRHLTKPADPGELQRLLAF
jgi:two-component system CheB/CheR fusion protein